MWVNSVSYRTSYLGGSFSQIKRSNIDVNSCMRMKKVTFRFFVLKGWISSLIGRFVTSEEETYLQRKGNKTVLML